MRSEATVRQQSLSQNPILNWGGHLHDRPKHQGESRDPIVYVLLCTYVYTVRVVLVSM